MDRHAQLLKWLRKSTSADPGYFYLLRFCDGVYKIGRTQSLKKRLQEHRYEYRTCDFEVVFALCTTKWRDLENCVRELFRSQIVEGNDWLSLSDADVAFITSLTADFVEGKISVTLDQKQDTELLIWLSAFGPEDRDKVIAEALHSEMRYRQTGVRHPSDRGKRAL